jgi:hypothetical protein
MQLLLFPHISPHKGERGLSPDDKHDLLLVLLRGGSPQAACQKLGLDPHDFCRAADGDAAFRTRLRHVRELMTHNVVATVYRAAMEGTPAAQALWLRTFPPTDGADSPSAATSPSTETDDDFASLSNDDLRRLLAAFHREFSGWLRSDESAEPA